MAKVSVLKTIEEIGKLIETAKGEATSFEEGGVAAAGKRVRKALQDIKKLTKIGRDAVTATKNERKGGKAKKPVKKKK